MTEKFRIFRRASGVWYIEEKATKQQETYAAMLEGIPRKNFNDEIIARWQKLILKPEGGVLIDPVRKPGPPGLPGGGRLADEAFGPTEMLPLIVCLGHRDRPSRDAIVPDAAHGFTEIGDSIHTTEKNTYGRSASQTKPFRKVFRPRAGPSES